MVCIYCKSATKIINSRNQLKPNNKWRRRQCIKCKAILTTIESIDYSKAIIASTNGKNKDFSRDKLFISIYSSCKHRKDAIESAVSLTNTIITKIIDNIEDASIDSEKIKQISKTVLKRFDKAAFAQYDAFHPK